MDIKKNLTPINHRTGRRRAVEGIAIHVMEGTLASARDWFRDPVSSVSANYGIGVDGYIEQWVEEDDEAWHAGRVNAPTAQIVLDRPGVNPNSYLIGIEHEGSGEHDLTEKQRAASAWLIADIARRHNFPIDDYHIVGHHTIYSLKACPRSISVPKLIEAAKAEGQPTVKETPRVVYSEYFGDYLAVTKVVSDREWYFVPFKQLPRGLPAQAPLSTMPLKKPA